MSTCRFCLSDIELNQFEWIYLHGVELTVCHNCHPSGNRFSTCRYCDDYSSDEVIVNHPGSLQDDYCPTCRDEVLEQCRNCDSWILQGDDCERCAEDEEEEEDSGSEYILNYSARAPRVLKYRFPSPQKHMLFGVELEVVATRSEDRSAEKIHQVFHDFAIMKEDSSLPAKGFEIVTLPATLETHLERWEEFGSNGPYEIEAFTHSKCGMHVHMSRKLITSLTLGKMIKFVNDPSNQMFVVRIAERSANEYTKFRTKKITDIVSHERYEAINTTPDSTIEVRIFKAHAGWKRILKNIEFCDALWNFAQNASHSVLTYKAFVDYVEKNRKRNWTHLYTFMKEKELLCA